MENLKEAQEDADDVFEDEDDTGLFDNLKAVIVDKKSAFIQAKQALSSWREEHSPTIESIQAKCDRQQKKLTIDDWLQSNAVV